MATLSKYTVQDALEMISDLRGESSTNTDAKRIRAVTRAEKDFAERKFWATHLLADQSQAGDGTSNYTIGSATYPMRLNGLCDIRIGGTSETYRYDIVDINTYKVEVYENSSAQVCYLWLDIANDLWKVHVNDTPAATDTIYYSFYWTPPKRTATTDAVVCPNLKIIAYLALGELYEGEDEVEKAADARNMAEQLIAELIGIDNAPAVNELKAVKTIEGRGIGTY